MNKKLVIIISSIIIIVVVITCIMMATNSRAAYTEASSKFYEGLSVFHLPISLQQVNRMIKEKFTQDWEEAEKEREEEEERNEDEWEDDDTIIYLDAGHGCTNTDSYHGTMVGTTCNLISDPKEGDTLYEYENTYRTALHVKSALEGAGYKVKMSRTQEEQDPNAPGNFNRGQQAAEYDGAVVIHYDGGGSNRVSYFGVYPSGYDYNQEMLNTFINTLSTHQVRNDTRNLVTKNLNLIHGYKSAGGDSKKILYVECGVMNGGTQAHQTWLASDQGQEEIAEAIVAAIKVGVPKKQKKKEQPVTDGNYPQECIDTWERTGYPQRGLHWNELDEATKAALYEHWKIHPEGW